MDVPVSLKRLNEIPYWTPSDRDVIKRFEASLEFEGSIHEKAQRLTEDIDSALESQGREANLWAIWSIIFELATCIPAGHTWQHAVLQCIGLLAARETFVPDNAIDPSWGVPTPIPWSHLPYFHAVEREKLDQVESRWRDRTGCRNYSSFVTQLQHYDGSGFYPQYPIWRLRSALENVLLEEQMLKGIFTANSKRIYDNDLSQSQPAFESNMWGASEWMIQSAGSLFQLMKCEDQPEGASLSVGDLCDPESFPAFSIDRWNYWKQRFTEKAKMLNPEGDAVRHVRQALRCMKAAEDQVFNA